MTADEAAFHDAWAKSTSVSDIEVFAFFEHLAAVENREILRLMGTIFGKSILDIGCGLGESSAYLSMKGARVTALDLSQEMIRKTQELGRRYGQNIEGVVGTIETSELPENHFDVVYMANILHHVEDRDSFLRSVARCLKPGGRLFAWDPIAYNPAINVYRGLAKGVRTPDERPLKKSDIALLRNYFQNVEYRTFWLTALALFLKYYFVDRLDPNEVRYWKRIYKEKDGVLLRLAFRLDSFLLRLPLIRWLGWNIVYWGQKAV